MAICDNLLHGIGVEAEPTKQQRRRITEMEELCRYALVRLRSLDAIGAPKYTLYGRRWLALDDDVIYPAYKLVAPLIYNRQLAVDGTSFAVAFSGVPRYVYCNRDHLLSVFFNLFENAVKYTSWQSRNLKMRVTSTFNAAEGLTVYVSDWGIGIPDESVATIFEAHARGTNAASIPGAGIGLWVARRFAGLYDADIRVAKSSDPTTFAVRFPPEMVSRRPKGANS
jgi:signal transduction histidine kinase